MTQRNREGDLRDAVMQAAKGRLYGGGLAGVARIGGQCRAVWNLFLAETVERYKAAGRFVFYAEMSACLPKLLRDDPRRAGLPHRAAQMTMQRLDRALKDCAKSKGNARRGVPRFRKHADRADAFSFVGREVRLETGRIRLPKIGWLRVRGTGRSGASLLALPPGADMKQVAATQEPKVGTFPSGLKPCPRRMPSRRCPWSALTAGWRSLRR